MNNRYYDETHENHILNTYKDVFKPIAIVICFICVFVFLFMYMIYKDSVENIYSSYLESEMESFEKVFDTFYLESKNIAMSTYMDADIRKISEGVSATKEDKTNAVRRLRQYKNFNIYAESICFYDADEQLFYSSEYNLPWDAEEFSADPELISYIRQKKTFILRQKQKNRNNVYTVIVYPSNGRGDAIAIDYYCNVVNSFFREGNNLVVADLDKRCFAGNFFSAGEDLSDEKCIKDIFDDNKTENILKTKLGEKRVIAAYKKTSDFIFINAEYTSVLMERILNKVLPWILILVTFLLVISYVLVTYGRKIHVFLYRVYKNIDNMKFKIQSNETNINKEKKNDFLRGLLFMTDEQLREAASNIDFNIDKDEKVNMVLMRIDHFQHIIQGMPVKYRESIRFSVMNVMEELLNPITKCDLNVMDDSEVIILYNTGNCNEEKIKELTAETQKLFRDKMEITISAFIGNEADNILGISEIYKTLSKLKEYSFYEGLGCILTVDYMQRHSDDKFNDTLEYRIQFANVLKTGSYDNMSVMFDKMIQLLGNSNPIYLKCELLQFAFQIQQLVLKMTDYNTKLTDIYSDIFNDIMSAETLDEIIVIFRTIFSYISENVMDIKGMKSDGIVTRVEKIVEEQYGDITFSRNAVAEQLNINANYADSLFKKQTSKTISTYITDYRLEKSKELLTTTSYSVNKIAGMVGYSGGSHFIYSFKKKFGMTPNEYRKIS